AIIAKAFRRAKQFSGCPCPRWAYSGYKPNQRPRQFTLDEVVYEIVAVLDQWYEPSATYFKVQSTERKTYLLRYDEETDEWTLQNGFDGDELLARPSIKLVTVDSMIAKKTEQQIESCEHCHPADAEIPFDWLLTEVTGRRSAVEFVLTEPVRCPNCKHEITEKTVVEPTHWFVELQDRYSAAPIFAVLVI